MPPDDARHQQTFRLQGQPATIISDSGKTEDKASRSMELRNSSCPSRANPQTSSCPSRERRNRCPWLPPSGAAQGQSAGLLSLNTPSTNPFNRGSNMEKVFCMQVAAVMLTQKPPATACGAAAVIGPSTKRCKIPRKELATLRCGKSSAPITSRRTRRRMADNCRLARPHRCPGHHGSPKRYQCRRDFPSSGPGIVQPPLAPDPLGSHSSGSHQGPSRLQHKLPNRQSRDPFPILEVRHFRPNPARMHLRALARPLRHQPINPNPSSPRPTPCQPSMGSPGGACLFNYFQLCGGNVPWHFARFCVSFHLNLTHPAVEVILCIIMV